MVCIILFILQNITNLSAFFLSNLADSVTPNPCPDLLPSCRTLIMWLLIGSALATCCPPRHRLLSLVPLPLPFRVPLLFGICLRVSIRGHRIRGYSTGSVIQFDSSFGVSLPNFTKALYVCFTSKRDTSSLSYSAACKCFATVPPTRSPLSIRIWPLSQVFARTCDCAQAQHVIMLTAFFLCLNMIV